MSACIVTVSALDDWSTAWDELVDQAPLPSPFLRSWWLDAIADPCAQYVLVVDGSTLVGGVALSRGRVAGIEYYRFLGTGKLCPDHLDLVSADDRTSDTVAALADWFTAPGSRVLDLQGTAHDAVVRAIIPAAHSGVEDVAPCEQVSGGADGYLGGRSTSFRRRIRRLQRQADRADVVFRRLEPAEHAAAMADFGAMHRARDDRAAIAAELPTLTRLVAFGGERGEVSIHVAEQHDCRLAVLISFLVGRRLSLYQVARSLDHDVDVGTLLDYVAICDACDVGATEIDFLRGAEPYKRSFVKDERLILRHQAAHGLGGRALLGCMLLGQAMRRRASTLRTRWQHVREERSGLTDQET